MVRLKYITDNEIAIHDKDWESAFAVAKVLVENKYAVMFTLEEDLIIINYDYAADLAFTGWSQANRNNVVFMNKEEFEEYLDKYLDDLRAEDQEEAWNEVEEDPCAREETEALLREL